MRHPLIQVKDLSFRYDEERDWVLKQLDLSVYQGEWLAVVGQNGSGKSTLAKLLNGLLVPQQGTVQVEGYATTGPEEVWEVRRRVGIVFQNPDNQFVGSTVRDDVAFGMENRGMARAEMIERLQTSVEKVGMTPYLTAEPHRLSGGQKQRVAIAGILAVRPSVIILDESTSMLDPQGKKEVMATVRELNQEESVTVMSITHDLDETLFADRICMLERGEIVATTTPAEAYRDHEILTRVGLDVPFSIQLRQKLQNEGIPLSNEALTAEELVEELWTLRSNI